MDNSEIKKEKSALAGNRDSLFAFHTPQELIALIIYKDIGNGETMFGGEI